MTDSSVRRSSSRDAAVDLRELGRPDLLGARAQRRDRRHDVERRSPRAELLGLLGDELLPALRLGAPAGERLGDDGLEVVDVVEETAVESRDLAVEVARDRDVDEEERMTPARGHVGRAEHELGCARRRDDDVDVVEMRSRVSRARSARRGTAARPLVHAPGCGSRRRRSPRRATSRLAAASSPIRPAPISRTRRPARSPNT